MEFEALAEGTAAAVRPLAYPANYWDQMFDIWIFVAVCIYLIVALPMLYFLYRYRYRENVNERGAVELGGVGIEVLWTVIPLIIVIYLAVQSMVFYTHQRTPPPDSLPVKADAVTMMRAAKRSAQAETGLSGTFSPVRSPISWITSTKLASAPPSR